MRSGPHALIVYASTSGSTVEVVRLICRAIPAMEITHFDLGTEGPVTPAWTSSRFDLVLAGTPTYGKGDWHSAWERRQNDVLPALRTADSVMLFALGDSRSHRATFAGGLGTLARFSRAAGARIIGSTIPTDEAAAACPAVEAGRLPGLAIQYRRQRNGVAAQIQNWLSDLPKEWREA